MAVKHLRPIRILTRRALGPRAARCVIRTELGARGHRRGLLVQLAIAPDVILADCALPRYFRTPGGLR
jgi:hypothetical protein